MDANLTAALNRMAGAVESTSTGLATLTTNAGSLATNVAQLHTNVQQNRADIDNLIRDYATRGIQPVNVTVDHVDAQLNAEELADAIVANHANYQQTGANMFTKEPPKLPILNKGPGHLDTLSRVSAMIRLWHPQAWALMTTGQGPQLHS